LRLDPEEQAIVVLEAIDACVKPGSEMAHLPDVVAICAVSGLERTLAYKVIDRWNNQCWRKIGTSIGRITRT